MTRRTTAPLRARVTVRRVSLPAGFAVIGMRYWGSASLLVNDALPCHTLARAGLRAAWYLVRHPAERAVTVADPSTRTTTLNER